MKSYLGVTRRANYCTICCVLMKCTDPRLRFLAVNSMDLYIFSSAQRAEASEKLYSVWCIAVIQNHSRSSKLVLIRSKSLRGQLRKCQERHNTFKVLSSTLFSAGRYSFRFSECHSKARMRYPFHFLDQSFAETKDWDQTAQLWFQTGAEINQSPQCVVADVIGDSSLIRSSKLNL